MSVLSWIVVVTVGWVAVAVGAGLVAGRVIRNRDQQIPVEWRRKPPHVPPPAPRTEARKTIAHAVHRTCGRQPE